jgi:hypothetical protein
MWVTISRVGKRNPLPELETTRCPIAERPRPPKRRLQAYDAAAAAREFAPSRRAGPAVDRGDAKRDLMQVRIVYDRGAAVFPRSTYSGETCRAGFRRVGGRRDRFASLGRREPANTREILHRHA